MTLISVILPNYNHASFLKERVRSVFNQTHQNIEVICVDDASTDNSVAVIRELQKEFSFRFIQHNVNSGSVYQRWNEAALLASGEWLWFPNTDDSAHPQFLEHLLKSCQTYPSVALAYARCLQINSNGVVTQHFDLWDTEDMTAFSGDHFLPGHQALLQQVKACYISTASGVLVRTNVFHEVGGFDIRLWGVADWDFYLKVLHRYDLAFTAVPLCLYRSHNDNTTSSKTTQLQFSILNAYCVSGCWLRAKNDSRFTNVEREFLLKQVQARVFDLFVDGEVVVPENLRFAADEIYKAAPDKRLLATNVSHRHKNS